MKEYIAPDSHKRYSLLEREEARTGRTVQLRIAHERGAVSACLRQCQPGSAVALEATGHWYWIVGEIEAAGLRPLLVHPRKAKLMMGLMNKTDKLDVHGLNRLQRTGTLPTVWIPPAELRELRELTRTRIVLVRGRTRLKNRLNATLAKYGLGIEASDPFGVTARAQWREKLEGLPPQTHFVSQQLLAQLDFIQSQVETQEKRLQQLLKVTAAMQRLQSLPGVGLILAATVALEIGDVGRFASHEHLASYAGTTPRVHASGERSALRPPASRRQPLPQMGLCRSSQRHCAPPGALERAPRRAPVPSAARSQRPHQSDWGSGPAFGRSEFLGVASMRKLSRSSAQIAHAERRFPTNLM